jgi:hypothetical protein
VSEIQPLPMFNMHQNMPSTGAASSRPQCRRRIVAQCGSRQKTLVPDGAADNGAEWGEL